jgi:hypothetical protein
MRVALGWRLPQQQLLAMRLPSAPRVPIRLKHRNQHLWLLQAALMGSGDLLWQLRVRHPPHSSQ